MGLIVNPSWRGQTHGNNYTELHHTCHIWIHRPKLMHKTKCEQTVTIFNISFVFLLSCLPGVSFCSAKPFRFPVSSLGTPKLWKNTNKTIMYAPSNSCHVQCTRKQAKIYTQVNLWQWLWLVTLNKNWPRYIAGCCGTHHSMGESALHVSHLTCPTNSCCGVYQQPLQFAMHEVSISFSIINIKQLSKGSHTKSPTYSA